MKIIFFALLLSIFASQSSLAGGIALSSTRVIYDGNKKEASLTINNKNKTEEFLVQSWIDDMAGNKKTPFIITPPLFKLDPEKNNVLRIVNINPGLPQDRESVYWVNVKAIPSKSDDSENKNVLQIAVRTRIKLFYRPVGLKGDVKTAPHELHFTRSGNQIRVDNPTVFNITFNQFFVNEREIEKSGMVPAKGSLNITLPAGVSTISKIKFNTINDFGSSAEMLTKNIN
ncbi:long polar fimbrial biogenesis chaperone LpfB [Escherichia sp. E2748]|uniref:long polar fimbrial biogenesis chaperone LpfB n=1 Tax=Escherichia sp. E2748 TaxID=2044460 RepID=UPI001080BD76|nr:long polar fimbrial biogenesis chaperone LpfB [Escherichia sp. E2748]TGB90766.1 molecular chaperone LpfB [Escherichia sp. E2748]TLI82521.1 molecular chaperone LpfB [Escherichia sp. E2748]